MTLNIFTQLYVIKLFHEMFLIKKKYKMSEGNRLVICMIFVKYIMKLPRPLCIIIF